MSYVTHRFQTPDGTQDGRCPTCYDAKWCRPCGGSGHQQRSPDACPMCRGTGVCASCRGTGRRLSARELAAMVAAEEEPDAQA